VVSAGPYAGVGLVDGSAQTAFSMPSYNPNAAPLSLEYNSAVADPEPVFIVPYTVTTTLTSLTAKLTITSLGFTPSTPISYDVSNIDLGDTIEIALQASGLSGSTGRYGYSIAITVNGSALSPLTGDFNFINGSTTPEASGGTASPFGAGWSLAGVEHLAVASGGVMIQDPDGTSVWFPTTTTAYSYGSPAGNFTSLSYNTGTYTYTQTFPDGSTINFTSTSNGYVQSSVIDFNGNTTSYSYNASNQLTTVTDIDGQVSTINYDGTSGLATAMSDPASRTATFSYSSSNLTAIVDAGNDTWTYAYSSHELTSIKDPRSTGSNYKTSFTYNFAGEVTGVTQPDSSTEPFTPEQSVGLPSGTSITAVLAATAFASYIDGNGQTWKEYVDGIGFGLPVETIDPLGDTEITERTGDGLPWLSADALGNFERVFYDTPYSDASVERAQEPDILKDVNPDGTYSYAFYYNYGRPNDTFNALGGSAGYAYSGDPWTTHGAPTSVTDPNGNVVSLSYSSFGQVSQLVDGNSNTTLYDYDSHHQLTEVIEDAGDSTHFNYSSLIGYDSASNVTSTTDENGKVTSYFFDNLGNVTKMILPISSGVSATYTYSYDTVGNETSVVEPISSGLNAPTTIAYDPMNRVTKVTDAMGYSTLVAYDGNGNPTALTDKLGHTATYGYDNASRLTQEVDPIASGVSATTTYSLSADGQATEVVDPMNRSALYSYDPAGRVATFTSATGDTLTYSYNGLGENSTAIQKDAYGNSATTKISYYVSGLQSTVTDPAGNTTTYDYDGNDNLTLVSGEVTNAAYSYDALNRKVFESDGGPSTTYQYDKASNATASVDTLGNTTHYTYNDQGEFLTQVDANGTGSTTYGYNLAGWLTSVADADHNTTTVAYNLDGFVTQTTNQQGYSALSSYNGDGNLTSVVDYAGRSTNYTYNYAGWLTSEVWVGGSYTATYGYDLDGEVTSASDNAGNYAFAYDNSGNLTQTQINYNGLSSMGTVTLNYEYHHLGLKSKMYDNLGASTTYNYNNYGLLTGISMTAGTAAADVAFGYHANGGYAQSLSSITMSGSGSDVLTAQYTYDRSGASAQPLTFVYSDSVNGSLASFTYTLDDAGQITGYQGPGGSSGFTSVNYSYGYDKDGQLTTVTDNTSYPGSGLYSYGLDANGNRDTTGYTTTTDNELTASTGGYTYTYDHNGNRSTMTDSAGDVWTYTWDYGNRLTEVVKKNNGGTTVDDEKFTYDVFNNLIRDDVLVTESTLGTSDHWTVYDGKNPYADFNSSGSLTMRYVTNPDGLNQFYARITSGGTVQWFVTDASGSIREIINQDGTILDKINYDPFGNIIYESNISNGGNYKFQGGFWSDTVKLTHFGDRWEDPKTGTWISQDPTGFSSGDANFYRFEINGPTYEADPTGDAPISGKTRMPPKGARSAPRDTKPTSPIFVAGNGCFVCNPKAGRIANQPPRPAAPKPLPKAFGFGGFGGIIQFLLGQLPPAAPPPAAPPAAPPAPVGYVAFNIGFIIPIPIGPEAAIPLPIGGGVQIDIGPGVPGPIPLLPNVHPYAGVQVPGVSASFAPGQSVTPGWQVAIGWNGIFANLFGRLLIWLGIAAPLPNGVPGFQIGVGGLNGPAPGMFQEIIIIGTPGPNGGIWYVW
jgi:RHS repeat-associated protein